MTDIISLAAIIIFIIHCVIFDRDAVLYRVIGLIFIGCVVLLISIFGGY